MKAFTCTLSFSGVANRVFCRRFSKSCIRSRENLNKPLSAYDLTRSGGIASMFRLPVQEDSRGLDACFIGVPFDGGASNRTGARFGPRQVRCESVLVRAVNGATGAAPYDSLMVADVGDIPVIPYSTPRSVKIIKEHMSDIIKDGCRPISVGGDHLIAYPILQAIKEKHGKVGLIHVDAHTDMIDLIQDEKLAHGTPFCRAVEEGLLDCDRVVQIGIRGSITNHDDYDSSIDQGFRVVRSEDCWYKSLEPLMAEVRKQMGDGPVYLSFDIDGLDPSIAPGTGTPEIGGLTISQGLEIIRGCRGLNIVGADLVEVSPPYDPLGTTALIAANLIFEMLCILPGVKYY